MDLNTRYLSAAFEKLPLALVTHNNGKTYRVVWDGDYDSISDTELRRVVIDFLRMLPTTPTNISLGMRRDIDQFEKDWKRSLEESEKQSRVIAESYNYPG